MRHFWKKVEGWCFYTKLLEEMVRDCSPTEDNVIVELGVWKGKSTAFIGVEAINSGKSITHVAVDWFKGSEGESAHEKDPDIDRLREVFDANVSSLTHQTKSDKYHLAVYPMDTVLAAEAFATHSVDYLVVDAAHTYEGVLRDLRAWYPKVKPGGIIGGDDWIWPGVQNAVKRFTRDKDKTVHLGNIREYPYWYFVR